MHFKAAYTIICIDFMLLFHLVLCLCLAPFSDCHKHVNVEPFIQKCKHHVCHCVKKDQMHQGSCRCQTIAAYAHKCARMRHPLLSEPSWRDRTSCELECDGGRIWSGCANRYQNLSCELLWDQSHLQSIELSSTDVSELSTNPGKVCKIVII